MIRNVWRVLTVVATLAAGSQVSFAQTHSYHFGTWLGGNPSYQPWISFAHMSVSTTDNQSFDFVLRAFDPTTAGNLNSAFGSHSYIGKALFNTVSGQDPIGISNIQTNGYVGDIVLGSSSGVIGGVEFDFYNGLDGRNMLQSGEWISWTLNFANPQIPLLGSPPVALFVAGFDQSGVTAGWYTPISPVPEPHALAMLLAGLGLMGFVARNRQRNLVST